MYSIVSCTASCGMNYSTDYHFVGKNLEGIVTHGEGDETIHDIKDMGTEINTSVPFAPYNPHTMS